MALPTKLTLKIVTPDHAMEYEVDEVAMPGVEGEFGVLPGHTPFFTALRTGEMWYRSGSEKHFLAVSVGFVEVLGHYNPRTKPESFDVNRERLEHWLRAGARLSDSVRTLLKRHAPTPAPAAAAAGTPA